MARFNMLTTCALYNRDLVFQCAMHGHQSISFIAQNQYCVMKKRDPFPMNEIDHKFGKIVIFSILQNFRNPKMLFDGLGVYLRHTSNSVPWYIN